MGSSAAGGWAVVFRGEVARVHERGKGAAQIRRRSFLKGSGLALARAFLGDGAGAAEESAEGAAGGVGGQPVEFVNVLQGTDSTGIFSRGNTLPIAARPFGMAHWTLQTRDNTPWMFAPAERRVQGLRCTHQLSPWLGDYGQATFLPFSGVIQTDAAGRASSYRPEDARLAPHRLALRLLRYGTEVELVPTERCAVMRAGYGRNDAAWLFDVPGEKAPECAVDAARRTISFASTANRGGVPAGFATYYVVRFDRGWTKFGWNAAKGHQVGVARFGPGIKTVEMRVGTSFISFEQAARNLEREAGTRTMEELRAEGARVWNEHLGRVEIGGATQTERRTFYSCLYRTLLFPRVWHEPDAQGAMVHRSPYNGKVMPGVMYADHGYWDVYRAWYPLMTVLFPERLGEILQAWVNAYAEGGWLPQFPCPGYRACMTGSLIDAVFGDAAAKKLGGFDLAQAYAGLRKHAMQEGNPDAGYGRRGLAEYLKYGYCPAGMVDQSAAETVDAAYGDFCLAQVARALGHEDDARMFLKRAKSWRHLFNAETGFLRGKKADGSWLEPFDPVTWGDPYVEGSAWQHRWDVPHDVDGLFAAMGGKEKAVAALEEMLAMAPDFNVGAYGAEIHEMSEMAAVPFGQYAHSNQPVHHVLYLFAAAGRPDRTRYWTRRVMEELYSPEGFAGDEDTGSMAAWYVLSALGFYPVCPGKAEYTLGQALFAQATVHLPAGRTLKVVGTRGLARQVLWNGSAVSGVKISHADVVGGGELRFV